MEAKQWSTVDKSKWLNRGEWDSEPDKMQWQDEATGLPCLIRRGPVGALCGYVGVAEGHPLYGKHYDDVEADVHGGLTFADACQPSTDDDDSRGICHVPAPGEPDHVWWFGFDCAHYGDYCPAHSRLEFNYGDETYKDIAYVQAECRRLAAQLAGAAS